MVDPRVLTARGSTTERLKQICTAERPTDFNQRPEEEQKAIDCDIERRKKLEDHIRLRLWESIESNLKTYQMYAAVDLAWDSTPINKATFPLMLYAQGKMPIEVCAQTLNAAGMGRYVSKYEKDKPVEIDLPKFYETNVNLIRSILTRRLAAQSNKYANLWPYYHYESRSTALPDKLRADVMSQRADIICDQYDYRHHEVQVMRDMLMYTHGIDFIRSSWEKEKQEYVEEPANGLETETLNIKTRVEKEGVCFVNPHPTRIFWDNNHPLSSLNSDSGIEWIGYWDVQRFRDVHGNTSYWNRENISYSTAVSNIFSVHGQYFSQYYTAIIGPPNPAQDDIAAANDRKNNVGIYAGNMGDTAVIVSNLFLKLVPKDWGIGDYAYPVWTRFVVASDSTIQFAEFLPSTPGAVASYNANDNRQANISFAMELMGYQDQLTNLLSYLLLCLQADNIKVMLIDTGVATPEAIKAFKQQLKGQSAYTGTTILEIDRSKLADLGISSPDQVIKLVETRASQLEVIFRAIGQLVQMVERMAALSPQEQGQPAPREISATETNLIAGTTESVYGFISDSIDEYRAAKKRILYESYMAYGETDVRVPVINRYPKRVIEAAGFTAQGGEQDLAKPSVISAIAPQAGPIVERSDRYTIIGTKDRLRHDYIFSSRDGAERPVNTQSAAVLVQLLTGIMALPVVQSAVTKEQFYNVVNEIFRQSGAGFDLKLEIPAGEENAPLGPSPSEQLMDEIGQMIDGLTKATERNSADLQNLKSVIEPLVQSITQRGAAPPQAMAA